MSYGIWSDSAKWSRAFSMSTRWETRNVRLLSSTSAVTVASMLHHGLPRILATIAISLRNSEVYRRFRYATWASSASFWRSILIWCGYADWHCRESGVGRQSPFSSTSG